MNTNLMQIPIQPQIWRLHKIVTQMRARLSLADYWFLFGFLLALFYVADPFSIRLEKIGLTKHLPLLVSLGGAMMINIGAQLFPSDLPALYGRHKKKYWEVLLTALPLALLGLWITVGSLYARKHMGVGSSFITVGLYMLFTLVTARVVMLSQARESLVRAYLVSAVLASIFMVIKMAIMRGDERLGSYHELEALIIPLMVFFALQPGKIWPTLMTLFFIAGGFLFLKNTGFIVLGLTLLYLWIAEWRFRFRESIIFRFWTIFWLVVVVVAAMAVAGYLAYQRDGIMPSGNPQYRMRAYELAWRHFLESPFWGTGFTGEGTEKFHGYQITVAKGILPTHSDVLDLLAQGGVLAIVLWLWAYVRIGKFALKYALRGRRRDGLSIAAHTLACMSLTSIMVYAFNPILLQPAKALLLWGEFGMLLGIALYRRHTEDGSAVNRTDEPHFSHKNRLYLAGSNRQ